MQSLTHTCTLSLSHTHTHTHTLSLSLSLSLSLDLRLSDATARAAASSVGLLKLLLMMMIIAPLMIRSDASSSSSSQQEQDKAHHLSEPIASLIQEFGDSLCQFGNLSLEGSEGKWADALVTECAKAISSKSEGRVQHLLWILNELASPYGDCEQRLAFYFLQALFCRMSRSGLATHNALCLAMERSSSFDSMRRTILKFQEVSPWTTFGHVACNGAILEAFDGESKVHILDVSNTFCTQWPTLLEALATRPDGAPSLRLSTMILSQDMSSMKVMKEIGRRLERFARLMGVPFEFKVHQLEMNMDKLHDHQKLSSLSDLQSGEALAITCNLALHQLSTEVKREETSSDVNTNIDGRDNVLQNFKRMSPKILTLIEEEADMVSQDFLTNVSESLCFYSLYFETLQMSFPKISEERLILERIVGRNVLNSLACTTSRIIEGHEKSQSFLSHVSCDKRETSTQWDARLTKLGFKASAFSDDVMDDARALIKRYKEGWSLDSNQSRTCLQLKWKEHKAVFASTWK